MVHDPDRRIGYSGRMSFGSSLLRVLLCLAFACNGVSSAHAGMHPGHAMPADAAQSAISATMGGMTVLSCHEIGQGRDTVHPQPASPDTDDEELPAPDCCKGGCQCACLQHATPAVAMMAISVRIVHAVIQQHTPSEHAPPAMLRLNRPPIG